MADITVPSPRVLRWQQMERGMFIHFGINTFYDQEWGDGSEDPARFNPAALDADQWARTAKEAGFAYMVLTAKHHDGFCLWPTATTAHSVASSPWKDGHGDVVAEFAAACRRRGLGVGLYLSPWDRNAPCYSDPAAYDEFYIAQLTELMSGYGELCEVWFDGAGSTDRKYDWERIMATVRRYQPEAVVFNMGRPDIRWVGNEDGLAPYPCWNRATQARQSMFTQDMEGWLPGTPEWIPAECDVPIRLRHWFWHPEDEGSLLGLDVLADIYERSVGRGTNLLLNISPDRRGLLPETDVDRVLALGDMIRARYVNPQAATGPFEGAVRELRFVPMRLSHGILMEDIAMGERVRRFRLEAQEGDGAIAVVFKGSAIGHKQIIKLPAIRVTSLRLWVEEAEGTPRLLDLQLFGQVD